MSHGLLAEPLANSPLVKKLVVNFSIDAEDVEIGIECRDRFDIWRHARFLGTVGTSQLSNTDPDIKESAAWMTVQEQITVVTKDIPEDEDAVLPRLLAQSQADVIAMLGVLTSSMIYRRAGASTAEA